MIFSDDNGGGTQIENTHSVTAFQPEPGTYTLTATGKGFGAYSVFVRAFSSDGSSQPPMAISGLAVPGSTTTFQVNLVATPGEQSGVRVVASASSTLDDIENSFHLGLIKTRGIANSLSQKIAAAQRAGGQTKVNILNAFKQELAAQTGKGISGVAAEVLQHDVDALLKN